jgi:hypothetical protein
MHLAVITTGTLFGRVRVPPGQAGLLIGKDALDAIGVAESDELEVHTDGRMLILVPVERKDAGGGAGEQPREDDDA